MDEIKKLQDELKEWIAKVGLTQKAFAFLHADSIFEHEEDKDRHYKRFKKDISRSTTKPERIKIYLDFLYNTDDFKELGYIKPKFYHEDSFDVEFNESMKKISQNIVEHLIGNDNE